MGGTAPCKMLFEKEDANASSATPDVANVEMSLDIQPPADKTQVTFKHLYMYLRS